MSSHGAPRPEAAVGLFDRVVCGVDGSPQGLEAVRQAARLVPPGCTLTIVSAYDVGQTAGSGFVAPRAAEQLEPDARRALGDAVAELADGTDVQTRLADSNPLLSLRQQIEELDATLIAVGTHGVGRAVGSVIGRVAATMLHRAPCSVLIARPPADHERFPRDVAVAIDGSAASWRAEEAAVELARRLGLRVRRLVADDGRSAAVDDVLRREPGTEVVEGRAHEALVATAADTDLLLVGSRGLHGLRSLGSVSERVAHRAPCTVVVVR